MPEVQMPRLSDTMEEGVLSRWLKAEGDLIHRGDVIAEIETDKAVMELEAYDEGPLTALLVEEGATVPIGQPIAIIGEASNAKQPQSPARSQAQSPAQSPAATAEAPAGTARRATPLVRKIARERGIDLQDITGTGPGGRIVRADLEPDTNAAAAAAPPVGARQVDDEALALTTIRRITAQRLTQSVAAPTFYLTSVVDAQRLLAFRAEFNDALAEDEPRVSVTDLLVRACSVALRAHPMVNSSWDEDKILRRGRVNIGVAVATDAGLVVPVVPDADRLGIREIAGKTRSLTERARSGTLTPQEFSGGTFTISNLGMYGVDHFTAIINPPEAAILAVGAATPTPVVRDDGVVVRPLIKLTLSVDHRVVDGAPAAMFLRDLAAIVEAPMRLVG